MQSLMWTAIDLSPWFSNPKIGLISRKIRTLATVSLWIVACVFFSPSLLPWELGEFGNNTYCGRVNKKKILPNKGADEGY